MTTANRPNLIFIITDQQRADTIRAWGHSHMVTPAMDKLCKDGRSFRQAFCPGATCVASRAAIFTGMYPHTTGVYSFDAWAGHRSWVEDLADAGYRCINIGKMHITPQSENGGFHERIIVENPTNKELINGGADDDWGRYLTHHGESRPNDRHETDSDWIDKVQGVPWHLEERFHSDVFIGDAAVSWIRSHRGDDPLFLQIGFAGPHEPWDPLPRHLELYHGVQLPDPVFRESELDSKPPQHQAHHRTHAEADHESRIDVQNTSPEQIDHMRRHYYAKITTVDEQIGRVLEALDERGWRDNSLLVFCSDHGELLGDHNLAYKWLMYDAITRVPLVVCDRREGADSQGGGVCDELVSLIDLGPTFLEAAGIDRPDYLEGCSLLPCSNSGRYSRDRVYAEDNYQIMMRTHDLKIVYYIGQELGELYNLSEDPDELWNLWEDPAHRETRDRLLRELLDWLASSTYWNAGYRRDRSANYRMRWPAPDDPYLHGRYSRPRKRQADL
ncbi:MAG: sulfatase-like hydrolase/transferase [Candidatus Latescibacterota bacterium]|nr:sulfatase-like hydrolase/transferase [Candidatus Latescibacterota bacterium]